MANGDGDSISTAMVLQTAQRVRSLVEEGDFDKCPVHGQQEVQLFLVDGMTAILKQAKQRNVVAILSGTTMGAVIVAGIEILKLLGK